MYYLYIADCSDGYYGVACSTPCNCNEPCDDISGECPGGNCSEGWIGYDCQNGKYSLISILILIRGFEVKHDEFTVPRLAFMYANSWNILRVTDRWRVCIWFLLYSVYQTGIVNLQLLFRTVAWWFTMEVEYILIEYDFNRGCNSSYVL